MLDPDGTATRVPRGVIVLLVFAAFSFGAVVQIAAASGHYHCPPLCHGFVHGNDVNDGSFFIRVAPAYNAYPRSCQVDTVNYPQGYRTIVIGDAVSWCEIWSRDLWQSATECIYRAETKAEPIAQYHDWHHHRPTNYCG